MRRRSRFSNILRLSIVAIVALGGGFSSVFLYQNLAKKNDSQALSATEFQPGRIIDDSIFYNPNTMTAAEIDAFIDSHSPACDMWGNGYSFGGVQNKEYARRMREAGNSRWHEPPYVCISEFYENPETHVTNFETNGVKQPGMLSAGEIIYKAAQTYNVNPQVLLVMLKKESYAWGDDWPLKWEYNTVMGYACPDGAPCNEEYFGFYNQMMTAAWQLNYYREHIYSYNYRPYATNNILYNPDRSCGSKPVYLENIATTSLYIYTPYVPNDDALRNYPGTSWCGSYGNRNFYMYFREWFGDTFSDTWKDMETPRYMQTKGSATKRNLFTGRSEIVRAGEIIFFTKKAYLTDDMCLKVGEDEACINYSDLEEVKWNWEPMETPRYMSSSDGAKLINLTTRQIVGDAPKDAFYAERITAPDGLFCLRLAETDSDQCVDFSYLQDSAWEKKEMVAPRDLANSEKNVYFVNPYLRTNTRLFSEPSFFTKYIDTPEGRFVCTDNSNNNCVEYSKTREVFVDMESPRELVLTTQSVKYNAKASEPSSFSLDSGLIRKYTKRTFYRSETEFFPCVQTEYDANLGTDNCIDFTSLDELPTDLEAKTKISVIKKSYKYYYDSNKQNSLFPLAISTTRYSLKKSYISDYNGDAAGVCYLTEYDVENNTKSCIKKEDFVIAE